MHRACGGMPGPGLECLLWNVCSSTARRSARCRLVRKSRRPSWSRTTLSCACAPCLRSPIFHLQSYQPNVAGGMRSPWTLPALWCLGVLKKFRSTVLHVISVGQQIVFSLSIQTLTLPCTRWVQCRLLFPFRLRCLSLDFDRHRSDDDLPQDGRSGCIRFHRFRCTVAW